MQIQVTFMRVYFTINFTQLNFDSKSNNFVKTICKQNGKALAFNVVHRNKISAKIVCNANMFFFLLLKLSFLK